MTEKIVVAINGSTGSTSALGWAIQRASTVDVSLELVCVIELDPVEGWPNADEVLPAYERMLIAAAQRVATEAPHVTTATSVRRGEVRRELLAAAAGCDLLVIGTREPTGYFSGTLRHHLASEAPCVVAVIPAAWEPRGGSIVVGVDSDSTSSAALDFAATEAIRLSRTLDVVHAWRLPVTLVLEWLSAGADPYRQIRTAQEELLGAEVADVRDRFATVDVNPILRQGAAASVLTDVAEHASAVVIGTHRRSLMASAFLGSVGHDLLLSMPCPVLVVPTSLAEPR